MIPITINNSPHLSIASHDEETIIAQCTPSGNGAIALLRISGTNAVVISSKLSKLASGKTLNDLATHTIHYGLVIGDNEMVIDQVMFLLMLAPKTFTGQNTVEITCHNNPFIVEQIIQEAIKHGARLAQEGEFSRRAVVNNKIDLIQAEAINELINANTQMALKKSLAQLEGSLSHWITGIEKDLVKTLALSEASFEFIDESMEFGEEIQAIIKKVMSTLSSIKKNFDQQLQIRQGIRIALIGSVNAGKSSLFNALLNKKRAIVTNIAGTTRDVIEAGMYKNNNYWTLIDTAGLRQTDDVIEKEGIERSQQEAKNADVILLVIDSSRNMTAEERTIYENLVEQHAKKIIIVHNKIDAALPLAAYHFSDNDSLDISCNTRLNLDVLEKKIEQKIADLFALADAPFLLNQRHYNLVIGLEKKLGEIHNMLEHAIQYELLSLHLNDALSHLSELTGKDISEKGMDAVFREFCIGK